MTRNTTCVMLIKQFPKRQLHMALSLLINFDNFRIRKSEHFKGLLTDLPVRVPRTFKSASPERVLMKRSTPAKVQVVKLQYDLSR